MLNIEIENGIITSCMSNQSFIRRGKFIFENLVGEIFPEMM